MVTQNNHRRKPNWSNLPTEILQLIAEFFFNSQDSRNFRAVCKSWRHSTQISTFLPRSFNTSHFRRKILSSSIYLIHSLDSSELRPSIVLTAETTKGVTKFFNPFSKTPISNRRQNEQNLDFTKFRSVKLATQFHIVHNNGNDDNLFSSNTSSYVKVLVYFKDSHISVSSCRALALLAGGDVCELQPFGSCGKFEKAVNEEHNVDDIVSYKGEMYALEMSAKLRLIGKGNENHVVVHRYDFEWLGWGRRRKRLVASSLGDKLYMINPIMRRNRWPEWAVHLYVEVFELKCGNNSWCWELVSNFGEVDQVIFVTRDYCFFVAAAEFPGCQLRNCIVFSDDAFPHFINWGWDYGGKVGEEVAIYSVDDKDCYSLPVKLYSGFPVMLSSPLPMVLHNGPSTLPSQPRRANNGSFGDFDASNRRLLA